MKKIIVAAAALAVISAPALAKPRFDGAKADGGIFTVNHPLPGRSLYGTFVIEKWLRKELPGGDYIAELARAYQERADYESRDKTKKRGGDSNWYDATAFYEKSVAAANGQDVQPWTPAELGISEPKLVSMLTLAREGTIKRAARYRNVTPAACAQMVALVDHWMEQVREVPHSITEPDDVFIAWQGAYKACFDPEEFYGFPINSPRSTDNDRRIQDEPQPNLNEFSRLQAFAEEYGRDERSGLLNLVEAFIIVEGHASRTASQRYNLALGERRASFGKEIFEVAGVQSTRIGRESKGEDQPEVPTADGVEEYRNRRIVIIEK